MNQRRIPHVGELLRRVPPMLAALVAGCAAACGSSDSQVGRGGVASSGSTGSSGFTGSSASAGSAGSAGSLASGGSTGSAGASGSNASSAPVDAGGAGNSSGAGGSAVSSGSVSSGGSSGSGPSSDGGACPALTNLTLASNITLAVTWAATTAGNAGSGNVHIWRLSKYSLSGNKLTGTSQTCGLALPDLQLNGLGQLAASGSKVQIEVPPSVWALPSMPTFPVTATTTGWGAFTVDPSVSLYGLSLPASTTAATYAWPTSSWNFPQGTTFPDHDGDMSPGITATPRNGNGYVFPPTAVGLVGSAPVADRVYIVSRNEIAQSGKWTSCSDVSGPATVMLFDNHVVGCHVLGGSTCTTNAANTQADFLDQNRTVYVPGSATFVAKVLASSATCADALTAVP